MIYNFTGVVDTLDVVNIPGFYTNNFANLATQEIIIMVDADRPRTINLPPTIVFTFTNAYITIFPVSGNAYTNKITVSSGSGEIFTGNGLLVNSYEITQSYSAVRFQPTGSGQWLCPIQQPNLILTSDIRILSTPCQNLASIPQQLLGAAGAGYFIDVISVFGEHTVGTTPYPTVTQLQIYINGCTVPLFTQGVGAPSNGCVLNSAAPFAANFLPHIILGTERTQKVNSALMLKAFPDNPGAGDGQLDLYLTYMIRKQKPL